MTLTAIHRFADVGSAPREFFWETDAVGRYVYVCERVSTVLGYMPGDMIGRPIAAFIPPTHVASFATQVAIPMANRDACVEAEHLTRAAHRRLAWLRIRAVPYADSAGAFAGYRGAAEDISERREAEERIRRLAHHDPLTEMPNRRQFLETLSASLDAARAGSRLAVLLLGLDRFSSINKSMGHAAGDEVLVQAGARITRCIGANAIASRLGGDEFAVLVPGFRAVTDLRRMANHLAESLRFPFNVGGTQLRLTASIGVATFPHDGIETGTLMRCADAALHRAKEEGSRSICFFVAPMGEQAQHQLALENGLAEALERRQFVLHYQPIYGLAQRRIVGAEALVRWKHPTRGLLLPGEFLEVAEKMALTPPLEDWILKTACREAATWEQPGVDPPRVAVNLTARHFSDPRIVDKVQRALAESGLAPERLDLELTETAMLRIVPRTVENMRRLAALGVKLSLDDFGTGYSNLAYLARLPIERIKVDRLFVSEVVGAESPLLEAILTMARGLRLRTVAEGVEKIGQLDFLRRHGCDEVQGHFFSRAMESGEMRRSICGRLPQGAAA